MIEPKNVRKVIPKKSSGGDGIHMMFLSPWS